MIVGMGIDVAEVERIRGAIERHGEVFLRRVFTAKEREYCERFKNKFDRGVRWMDIEVVRQKGGRPTLALEGEARKIADQLGVKHIALSITHTAAQAFAQVIFEG